MDAPPTQYRVIERDGKLIVLDARTNLPPKQAADMHPGRATDRLPERISASELLRDHAADTEAGSQSAEQSGMASHITDRFEQAVNARYRPASGGEEDKQITPMQVGMFGFAVFMVLGISIGGFTGFLVGAVAIIIAGNLAMKARKDVL
ncbi:hypothetical protein [Parasphingopyxis lamellibrachiae]|uniref:Uncharacterized protein n=1 Tax=Parasphingopyxis lamellibrachiae TaxID=680125 RepID=A0A3D9FGI5_9SPHN|nr:hypothetical protein [Parasphingopyxis lamellibrachiae]RED16920.1 hypothetical protein DFR46_1954 [Parasphingopyxis lamellibrachiae]